MNELLKKDGIEMSERLWLSGSTKDKKKRRFGGGEKRRKEVS